MKAWNKWACFNWQQKKSFICMRFKVLHPNHFWRVHSSYKAYTSQVVEEWMKRHISKGKNPSLCWSLNSVKNFMMCPCHIFKIEQLKRILDAHIKCSLSERCELQSSDREKISRLCLTIEVVSLWRLETNTFFFM